MSGLRTGTRRRATRLAAAVLALGMLSLSSPAAADEYDSAYAGHPLRIVAYVLHPLGVVVDYLILRPAHWVGNHEPFSTLFGHDDH